MEFQFLHYFLSYAGLEQKFFLFHAELILRSERNQKAFDNLIALGTLIRYIDSSQLMQYEIVIPESCFKIGFSSDAFFTLLTIAKDIHRFSSENVTSINDSALIDICNSVTSKIGSSKEHASLCRYLLSVLCYLEYRSRYTKALRSNERELSQAYASFLSSKEKHYDCQNISFLFPLLKEAGQFVKENMDLRGKKVTEDELYYKMKKESSSSQDEFLKNMQVRIVEALQFIKKIDTDLLSGLTPLVQSYKSALSQKSTLYAAVYNKLMAQFATSSTKIQGLPHRVYEGMVPSIEQYEEIGTSILELESTVKASYIFDFSSDIPKLQKQPEMLVQKLENLHLHENAPEEKIKNILSSKSIRSKKPQKKKPQETPPSVSADHLSSQEKQLELRCSNHVWRWFDPIQNPFLDDPHYATQNLSEKKKEQIRRHHRIPLVIAHLARLKNPCFDFQDSETGTKFKAYAVGADIITIGEEAVERGVCTFGFYGDELCHSCFTTKPQEDLIQEYIEKGYANYDFPTLQDSLEKVKEVSQSYKIPLNDRSDIIFQETTKVTKRVTEATSADGKSIFKVFFC